jgi:actin related protein 2/3 complex, subunit 3
MACGIPILPLRAGDELAAKSSDNDIVDEAIQLFRATILFKNFKPEGPADKLIVYLTCFIQKCLFDIQMQKSGSKADSLAICTALAKKAVPNSTNNDFFMRKLGLMIAPTGGASEEQKYSKYVSQLKEACASRLVETVYANDAMDLKFWLGCGRKPFLG